MGRSKSKGLRAVQRSLATHFKEVFTLRKPKKQKFEKFTHTQRGKMAQETKKEREKERKTSDFRCYTTEGNTANLLSLLPKHTHINL